MPRRGTKEPKRTDTIHQSVIGSEAVVMRPKWTHLRLNQPELQ
jgi:hypothetical protein